MFSLIELIISLTLMIVMMVGIYTAFGHAQASSEAANRAHAALQEEHKSEVSQDVLVQGVLDQAQIIVGASNVYASEHNGNWPTTIRELTEGRYLSSSVLPDTRVSSQQYRLVKDTDGFSVQLVLANSSVCDQIEWSAAQNGKSRNGSFYPYDCYAEMKTFVFRP